MEKDFQAGWYYNERTGMKEIFYLSCYTPVSIDKWFGRIHLNAEMKNLLLRIYHKIGKLEREKTRPPSMLAISLR